MNASLLPLNFPVRVWAGVVPLAIDVKEYIFPLGFQVPVPIVFPEPSITEKVAFDFTIIFPPVVMSWVSPPMVMDVAFHVPTTESVLCAYAEAAIRTERNTATTARLFIASPFSCG